MTCPYCGRDMKLFRGEHDEQSYLEHHYCLSCGVTIKQSVDWLKVGGYHAWIKRMLELGREP